MAEAKRDRNPRPQVGSITCQNGHTAEIRKQTNGKLFVYCPDCKTTFKYEGEGGQDFLLKKGNFDKNGQGEKPDQADNEKTVYVDIEKQQPAKQTREPLFPDDPDF